ncbi:zf-CCHC domain-containing protein [Tanacetum coccineum]
MEKDSKIYKGKKERVKYISLKAKKESSDDDLRHSKTMMKNIQWPDGKKRKSDRKCFRCGDPNHLIGNCPKPRQNKYQKAFVGGCWSKNENEAEDKNNDETCLIAQSSTEVTLKSSHYSDNASSLDDDSLGFDSSKASTSGTKSINFIGSSAEIECDGSTIKAKKLIHNKIEESNRPFLKPSLKNALGYVKTKSRSKAPPPRRNNSS